MSSKLIVQEVFGGLLTLSLDHQPVLDLAANCRINEDGTVYTFILRDNARFQDGKPVTAHYYLPLILDPDHLLNEELHRSPPDFDVCYIGLNGTEPPFDDPRVRQALNYAIDLQSIADDVLGGRVSPARGVILPGFPSYTDALRSYEYDPDLARELIQGSTYGKALASGAFPAITLTITGSFSSPTPAYLQAILEQWRQELGIEVSVRQIEWADFIRGVGQRKYQMFSVGWIASYPDPAVFLQQLFHSNSGANQTNYSNPEVDRLLDEGKVERNRERRFRIYNRVEQMVLDDAPWVWMWFSGEGYALIKPEVSGYFLTQMPVSKYRYVYFSEPTEVR